MPLMKIMQVHRASAGDLVIVASGHSWEDDDVGRISTEAGSGLLMRNPTRETKYAICFIKSMIDETYVVKSYSEAAIDEWCHWIPIPDRTQINVVRENAAPPTDSGVKSLRSQMGKEVWDDYSKPAGHWRSLASLKSDESALMYLTPAGLEYLITEWEKRYTNIRKGALTDRKSIEERDEELIYFRRPRRQQELMKRFGDDRFYEYLSEGFFSLDPSKSYENYAYSSPGANMEDRLGKTAAKLFNLEDKRSFQDRLLKQQQPAKEDSENVSSASVIDSIYDLEGSGPQSLPSEAPKSKSRRQKIMSGLGTALEAGTPFARGLTEVTKFAMPQAGKTVGVGRDFALGKFGQSELGKKMGVQSQGLRMLGTLQPETHIMFTSNNPDGNFRRGDKGIVLTGRRGQGKAVYFPDTGETIYPDWNTMVQITSYVPTRTTGSEGVIRGTYGTIIPQYGQFRHGMYQGDDSSILSRIPTVPGEEGQLLLKTLGISSEHLEAAYMAYEMIDPKEWNKLDSFGRARKYGVDFVGSSNSGRRRAINAVMKLKSTEVIRDIDVSRASQGFINPGDDPANPRSRDGRKARLSLKHDGEGRYIEIAIPSERMQSLEQSGGMDVRSSKARVLELREQDELLKMAEKHSTSRYKFVNLDSERKAAEAAVDIVDDDFNKQVARNLESFKARSGYPTSTTINL